MWPLLLVRELLSLEDPHPISPHPTPPHPTSPHLTLPLNPRGMWKAEDTRLLRWAHDSDLNQSLYNSTPWHQWLVEEWTCDIMRGNPGILASRRASLFFCPEDRLSILPPQGRACVMMQQSRRKGSQETQRENPDSIVWAPKFRPACLGLPNYMSQCI